MRPVRGPAKDEQRDRDKRARHHTELEADLRRGVWVLLQTGLDVPALVEDVKSVLRKSRQASAATLPPDLCELRHTVTEAETMNPR